MKKLAVLFLIVACSKSAAPVVAPPTFAEPGLTFTYPVPKYDSLWNEAQRWKFSTVSDSQPWTKSTVRDMFRAGYSSQRVELRPGNCNAVSFQGLPSDCANNNERAEVTETDAYAKFDDGDEWWYGWSLYVPETVRGQYHWFGQFQQMDSFKPVFMFQKTENEQFCLVTPALKLRYPGPGIWNCQYGLIPDREFAGHWHDIVVHAKWTFNNTGFFSVWVNGMLKVEFTGATRASGPYPANPPSTNVYFKYGIYRVKTPSTTVAFYDEVRKGKTREEVDIRILEKR